MKPPKTTWAWAIWLDWSKFGTGRTAEERGRWYRASEPMPMLFSNRRAARAAAHFDFERVVRVKIVRTK